MSPQDTSAHALTISDIDTTINHEPRIRDTRLAEYLGYAKVQDLRQLARRHRQALERFGEVSGYRDPKPGPDGFSTHGASKIGEDGISPHGTGKIGRGRPSAGHAYNKRQALYLCAKSDLPNGIEKTIEMVEVFDAFTAGRLAPERAALPAPEPPPFCAGCAAREIWNSPLPLSRDGHPLKSGPLTAAELMQVVVFRLAVRKAVEDTASAAVEQALAAATAAARTTLNSPP